MNIYVGNLSFNATKHEIEDAFGEYGEVKSVNIITDRETGRSRGFGFVEMHDGTSGQQAIEGLNNRELDGRTLTVNEAKPRDDRRKDGGDRW